jgi:DNA repair ATPase RecN
MFVLTTSLVVFGQDDVPDDIAPPPIRSLSKSERSALDAVTDVKDRTKVALDLMEARLKKAETLTGEETYGQVLTELGGFQAIMNNTIVFLNRNDNRGGKVMNTFKKFELALRAFTPRIELIRRETPDRYEYHVRQVLKSLRDTRAQAVEPLFSNTVLPN